MLRRVRQGRLYGLRAGIHQVLGGFGHGLLHLGDMGSGGPVRSADVIVCGWYLHCSDGDRVGVQHRRRQHVRMPARGWRYQFSRLVLGAISVLHLHLYRLHVRHGRSAP